MKANRILALLLCMALLLALAPVSALAAAGDPVTLYVNSATANNDAVRGEGATYKTIMGAYGKAISGDTIKLAADVVTLTTESLMFKSVKSFIFDFNGHTLTCSYNPNSIYGFSLYQGNSVMTIRDSSAGKTGRMVFPTQPYSGKDYFISTAISCNSASSKIIIEDCTVVAPTGPTEAAKTFKALFTSGRVDITGNFNVVGEWDDSAYGNSQGLYGVEVFTDGSVYVEDSGSINAPGGIVYGNRGPVWLTEASASKLRCKASKGTVAIPLNSGTLTLTGHKNTGAIAYRVAKDATATLDLNGYNITGDSINFSVPPGTTLNIVNSGTARSTISNGATGGHNILNYGDLTINGAVTIKNGSASSGAACIYQEGDSYPIPYRPPNYVPTRASSVLGEDVVLDSAHAAMYCDFSYQETSRITINGSTLISASTTPLQVPNGFVTINGGTFIGPDPAASASRLEGVFAGTNTRHEIKLPAIAFWYLENVVFADMKNVNITAAHNGIYLDQRLEGAGLFDKSIALSNITLNKSSPYAANTGIMNLCGKNITLSGKDTYFVCDQLYATVDDYVFSDGSGVYYTDPPGTLTVTAGIYSLDPSQYVPEDGQGLKRYAVLRLSDAPYRDLVAPWTRVGVDNVVSLCYPAGASDQTVAYDDVDIVALDDVDFIVPDPAKVQPKHFTLSSSDSYFTPIPGLEVTAFTGGNRLTIAKTKAAEVNGGAYVWYGGRCIGPVVFLVGDEPTYDVSGDITGSADALPTAKLVRDGVDYPALVSDSGLGTGYKYHVNVPAGEYNLVVYAKINASPVIVTVLVSVGGDVVKNIALPNGTYNSVVAMNPSINGPGIGVGTPNIEAGGLDDMAQNAGNDPLNAHVLIQLGVTENDSSLNASEVQARIDADPGMRKGVMMDLDLTSSINSGPPALVTQVNQTDHGVDLITVVFHLPGAIQGKTGYAIYRYHGVGVDKIIESPNADGEYMVVDTAKTTVTARLKKFSTYAIGYLEPTGHTIYATAGFGGSIFPGGAVTVPHGATQSFSVLPNAGYLISGVFVDGQSMGALPTCTFSNVIASHTIHAEFVSAGGGTGPIFPDWPPFPDQPQVVPQLPEPGDTQEPEAPLPPQGPDPYIVEHPTDQTVFEGGQATFAVVAQGTEPLRYQWHIDRGHGWEDISGATEAEYTTSVVDLGNDGYQYRCTVSNDKGSDTSYAAALNVVKRPNIPKTDAGASPGLWLGASVMALFALGLVWRAVKRGRR